MQVYLSGPITGLPDGNREAFVQAAARLRDAGYDVHSPVEDGIERHGSWEASREVSWVEHLRRDVAAVSESEGIVLLPGWESSEGANLELNLAMTLEMPLGLYDATRTPPVEDLTYDRVRAANRPGDRRLTARTRPTGLAYPEDREADDVAGMYDVDGRFISYLDNPLRHVYESGGIKDNKGKPRLDLIPSQSLVAIGEVLEFGARKYRTWNWARGLSWSDTFASLQRHLLAWHHGEEVDPETGLTHLAHANCQALFLLYFALTGTGTDDRWTGTPTEESAA